MINLLMRISSFKRGPYNQGDMAYKRKISMENISRSLQGLLFAGINFRESFYGHFAGINFRELGFTKDFAEINFCKLSLT